MVMNDAFGISAAMNNVRTQVTGIDKDQLNVCGVVFVSCGACGCVMSGLSIH